MDTAAFQWFHIILGSGGFIGILFVFFRCGKVVQKIESIEKRIDKIDEKLGSLDRGQNEIRIQLGKLETRVEERTLRVIQTTKEIRPDPVHFASLNLQEETISRNVSS